MCSFCLLHLKIKILSLDNDIKTRIWIFIIFSLPISGLQEIPFLLIQVSQTQNSLVWHMKCMFSLRWMPFSAFRICVGSNKIHSMLVLILIHFFIYLLKTFFIHNTNHRLWNNFQILKYYYIKKLCITL